MRWRPIWLAAVLSLGGPAREMVDQTCRPSLPPWGWPICSSRRCSRQPSSRLVGATFALVTMLGLLGLRIFQGTGSNIENLREETAIGHCACGARATRSSTCRCPGGEPRDRTGHRRTDRWTYPADLPWKPDGTRTAPSAAAVPRRTSGRQPAAHAPSHAPTPSSAIAALTCGPSTSSSSKATDTRWRWTGQPGDMRSGPRAPSSWRR